VECRDIADLLLTLAAYAFADMEDRCGFLGDGTSTYGGITGISKLLIDGNHTAGAITAATGVDTYAEITITDISTMLGKVRADAIPGAAFFVSQMCFALTMCRLAGANGGIGVVDTPTGPRPSFLGFPVYATGVLSQSTGDLSGATMMLFGDLKKAVTLADRREPTIARADQAQKFAEDQVQFRITERIDINVLDAGDNTSAGSIVALVGE
jgi:HK97 family phage major capsid protein